MKYADRLKGRDDGGAYSRPRDTKEEVKVELLLSGMERRKRMRSYFDDWVRGGDRDTAGRGDGTNVISPIQLDVALTMGIATTPS